jgi:hypothetical protein
MARTKLYCRSRAPPTRCVPAGTTGDDVAAALSQHRAQARCAAASAAASAAPDAPVAGLGALPHSVLLRIFALLPVRERLLILPAVARSWRRFARAEAAQLWADVNLSCDGDWVDDALLRAVTAASGGALRSLDFSGCFDVGPRTHASPSESDSEEDSESDDSTPLCSTRVVCITRAALHAALGANAATLRALRAVDPQPLRGGSGGSAWPRCALPPTHVFALLRAASALRALHADVVCRPWQVTALLAREGPFRALQVRRLTVSDTLAEGDTDECNGSHVPREEEKIGAAAALRAAAAVLLQRGAAAPAAQADDAETSASLEELAVDFGGDANTWPMGGAADGATDEAAAAAVELAAAARVRALSLRGACIGEAAGAALRAVPSLTALHLTLAQRCTTRRRCARCHCIIQSMTTAPPRTS